MKRDEAIVLVLLLAAAALAFLTILVLVAPANALIIPMGGIWGGVIAGAFALLRKDKDGDRRDDGGAPPHE